MYSYQCIAQSNISRQHKCTNLPSPNLLINPSIPNLSSGLSIPYPPILRLLITGPIRNDYPLVAAVAISRGGEARRARCRCTTTRLLGVGDGRGAGIIAGVGWGIGGFAGGETAGLVGGGRGPVLLVVHVCKQELREFVACTGKRRVE
jgi:hypothetical protein